MGRLDDAERHCNEAIEALSANDEQETLGYGTALNNLGLIRHDQARNSEAIDLYRQSLSIYQDAGAQDHPFTYFTRNNLGIALSALSRYADAERELRQSMALLRAAVGERHPLFAVPLETLSIVLRDTGRYEESRQAIEQVLSIFRAAHGDDHPETLRATNNAAEFYKVTGDYASAERLYKQALAQYGRTRGKSDPLLAILVDNLGDLYTQLGRYPEARRLHHEALTSARRQHEENHPGVATIYNHLSQLYQLTSNTDAALSFERRASEIYEAAYGHFSANVARSLLNIASLSLEVHELEEATARCGEAHEVALRVFGPRHDMIAHCLSVQGNLAAAKEEWKEAARLLAESLRLSEALHGESHPSLFATLNNLALALGRGRTAGRRVPLAPGSLPVCRDLGRIPHPGRGGPTQSRRDPGGVRLIRRGDSVVRRSVPHREFVNRASLRRGLRRPPRGVSGTPHKLPLPRPVAFQAHVHLGARRGAPNLRADSRPQGVACRGRPCTTGLPVPHRACRPASGV